MGQFWAQFNKPDAGTTRFVAVFLPLKRHTSLLQQRDHPVCAHLQGFRTGVECKIGVLWWFVGRRDSSEVFNFARTGALIKSLGVPALADLDRATGIDLDKVLFANQLTHALTVFAERGNECGERDHAGLYK